MAVAEGFEPSDGGYPSHAFEACSLGRSDTPPRKTLPDKAGRPRIGRAAAGSRDHDQARTQSTTVDAGNGVVVALNAFVLNAPPSTWVMMIENG